MKRLALALLLPTATLAGAQPLDDGTIDVYFQQISRQGMLEGCSLVFTALARDHAYLRGAQVVMNGSIAVRTLGNNDLLFTGKLGTRRWQGDGPSKEWEAPAHFHFATKNGSTAEHAKITQAETPGYKLLIARATEDGVFTLVKEMTATGEFTVGFNRKPDGQDVYSPIKINVALTRDERGNVIQTRNDETGREFAACLSRLAVDLTKRLGDK
jgi:hypothetical protein